MLNNIFFPKLKPPFLSQLKNLISDLEGVGSDWFLSVLLTLLPTFPECREQTSQKLCIKVHRSPHKSLTKSNDPSALYPSSQPDIQRFTVPFQEKCDLEKAYPALETLQL